MMTDILDSSGVRARLAGDLAWSVVQCVDPAAPAGPDGADVGARSRTRHGRLFSGLPNIYVYPR